MTIVTSTTPQRFGRSQLGRTAARSVVLTAAVLGLLLASSMPAAAKANCPPGQGGGSSHQSEGGSHRGGGGSSHQSEGGSRGQDGAAGENGSSSFGGFGSNGIGGHGGSGLGGLGSNGLNGLGGIDINSLTEGAGNIGATVGIGDLSVTAGAFGKHDCEGITGSRDKDVWRFAASGGSIISINARFSDAHGVIHNVSTAGSGSANASADAGNAGASASASVAISPDIAGLKLIGGSGVVKGVGAGVKVNLNLISTCPAKTSTESKPEVTGKTNTAQPSSVAVAAKQAMLPTTGSALTWYLVTAAAMLAIGMAFVFAVRRRRTGQQVV